MIVVLLVYMWLYLFMSFVLCVCFWACRAFMENKDSICLKSVHVVYLFWLCFVSVFDYLCTLCRCMISLLDYYYDTIKSAWCVNHKLSQKRTHVWVHASGGLHICKPLTSLHVAHIPLPHSYLSSEFFSLYKQGTDQNGIPPLPPPHLSVTNRERNQNGTVSSTKQPHHPIQPHSNQHLPSLLLEMNPWYSSVLWSRCFITYYWLLW